MFTSFGRTDETLSLLSTKTLVDVLVELLEGRKECSTSDDDDDDGDGDADAGGGDEDAGGGDRNVEPTKLYQAPLDKKTPTMKNQMFDGSSNENKTSTVSNLSEGMFRQFL